MKLGAAACHLGIGLVAGLVGTAAITASQMLDMRIRGRKVSNTPSKAAQKVLGIVPINEEADTRLSTLTHWAYGTGWGTFRSLLAIAGVRDPAATVVHAAAIEGTALVMLPNLHVAPPVKEWGAQEIGIEMVHHAIYATAAGLTYDLLCRSAFEPKPRRMNWNLVLGGIAAVGLHQLGRSLGLIRPSRIEVSRRLATVAWKRDWPQARRELMALTARK